MKQRTRITIGKSYYYLESYNLLVFELDTHLKKHSLPYKEKMKNEKFVLITSHLQEAKGTDISDNESVRPASFTS